MHYPALSLIVVDNASRASERQNPMLEFFHGWRRKAGCVTLLMACALAGLWVGSFNAAAIVWFRHLAFYNDVGRIGWVQFHEDSFGWDIGWHAPRELARRTPEPLWRFELKNSFVAHWLLAIPLTLLAVYLILWKPRKRKAESDA